MRLINFRPNTRLCLTGSKTNSSWVSSIGRRRAASRRWIGIGTANNWACRSTVFLQRYRQDEPQPGWPYLIVSDLKERQKNSYYPKSELQEQYWHIKAGVVNARIVMPEDDILYRDRLRSPEQPRYDERLYCFLDNQLCLIRYVLPGKETRKGSIRIRPPCIAVRRGRRRSTRNCNELPRANFRRWPTKTSRSCTSRCLPWRPRDHSASPRETLRGT